MSKTGQEGSNVTSLKSIRSSYHKANTVFVNDNTKLKIWHKQPTNQRKILDLGIILQWTIQWQSTPVKTGVQLTNIDVNALRKKGEQKKEKNTLSLI